MKRYAALALIAAVAAAAAVSPTLANERGGSSERIHQRADLNGDGTVSPSEASSLGVFRFLSLDSDGDGVLTEAEMLASAQERVARRIAKKFARLDKNSDGRVGRAEFDEVGAARFARLDTDGDGRVSDEEFRARKPGKHRN